MDVTYHWSFVDSELRVERIVSLNGTSVAYVGNKTTGWEAHNHV